MSVTDSIYKQNQELIADIKYIATNRVNIVENKYQGLKSELEIQIRSAYQAGLRDKNSPSEGDNTGGRTNEESQKLVLNKN